MINVDDLVEEPKTGLKKIPYTLTCDHELKDLIDRFRDRHGGVVAAEVIRRLIREGLPDADKRLQSKKK